MSIGIYVHGECVLLLLLFLCTRKDKLDGLTLMPHRNQSCISVKKQFWRITGIYISARGLIGSERICYLESGTHH